MFLGLYTSLQNRLHELRNENGATAVEYGMLVALIAAVIVATIAILGGDIKAAFEKITSAI